MATKAITSTSRTHGRAVVTWEALGDADDGSPFTPPDGYDLESVQFIGTIGGATLAAQGSNNDADWADLDSETALGFAIPGGQAKSFRPATTGGTGTDIDAIALFRQKD